LAVAAGRKDLVALLLANKADVNATTIDGMTPLQMASGHKDLVKLLRQHGAHE
jgi:ankyrin repeat protein